MIKDIKNNIVPEKAVQQKGESQENNKSLKEQVGRISGDMRPHIPQASSVINNVSASTLVAKRGVNKSPSSSRAK